MARLHRLVVALIAFPPSTEASDPNQFLAKPGPRNESQENATSSGATASGAFAGQRVSLLQKTRSQAARGNSCANDAWTNVQIRCGDDLCLAASYNDMLGAGGAFVNIQKCVASEDATAAVNTWAQRFSSHGPNLTVALSSNATNPFATGSDYQPQYSLAVVEQTWYYQQAGQVYLTVIDQSSGKSQLTFEVVRQGDKFQIQMNNIGFGPSISGCMHVSDTPAPCSDCPVQRDVYVAPCMPNDVNQAFDLVGCS